MLNKKALWKGLTSVFCFLLALSIILGGALEANRSTIDTYMGTLSEVFVNESVEGDPLYDEFKPSDEVLNDNGTGNSHALIQKAIDLGRAQGAEGAVLLKNDNDVLPLSEGSNVTLFGIRSHLNLIGSSFGMKCWGPYISLEQALSQNRTDFANTITLAPAGGSGGGGNGPSRTVAEWTGDEFDFDGAGFNLNQTMIDIYTKLNDEVYQHTENAAATNSFDPNEPSLAEIAGVNADYKNSFAQYGDAAIVYIARASSESNDYLPGGVTRDENGNSTTGAEEPFELTTNEKDAIALAKECSDKVIVLIASSSAVEIADLKNDPEVDAIMWIGAVGNYGNLGIADILSGKVSPSGGLFDIFASYGMSAPAMQNMGHFEYSNADSLTRSRSKTYTIEAEGIYVGYRYYETRYYDSVVGRGNATDKTGAYGSTTEWNYTNEVAYGFGYGLSYTDFKFELVGDPELKVGPNVNTGATDYYLNVTVKVTNTGDVAAKTPVQIYGQAPYYDNGIEKSAIQLMNFDKTDIIEPGASQTITIPVDLQYIASFDEHGAGTYVFENGDYYFTVGNGAHDALNNVMAAQGYTTADGMDYDGNADVVYKLTVDGNNIPNDAFSTARTGYEIKSQIPYADWNYYQEGEVTYLSRMDWAGTWPKTYSDMTVTDQGLFDHLNGFYYEIQTDDDVSDIAWGQNNGIAFHEMAGVAYDDPMWDELLDQITMEEAQYIATFGGPSIPGIESINLFETYQTENAGNGIAVALNATKDPNAPWAIPADDVNGNWHPEVFCNAPLGASSFNPDLYYRLGNFVGEESLFAGINILWGPGLNTHRHAYNGRNGEYYSEDPILSGVAAMEFAIGALQNGLVAAPKHFAFNDQETNRNGIAPYMTEQRAREVELRAYQYAFEATKYDTADYDAGMRGLMVSFSKIGGVECTASYGLMTEILAKEWGFIGYAVTDIYDDFDIYGGVLSSGTTCYDTRGMSGFYTDTTLSSSRFANQVDGVDITTALNGDRTLQLAVKESVHKNLFAMSESHLMNRYNSTTSIQQVVTWWRGAYYACIAVSAVLMVGCAALYVMSLKRKESEVK